MSKKRFDFEKAIVRAEEIAAAIEQGEIGLEESIKHFEEGMALIERCRDVLNQAELKIQKLEAARGGDVSVGDDPTEAADP